MKKIIFLVALIVTIGIASGTYALTLKGTQEELNQIEFESTDVERRLEGGIDLDKYLLTDGTEFAAASTSPIYQIAAKASSSVTISTANAKHIDLNILALSSTTIPNITWQWFFSSDDGANKNWYPEEGVTVTLNTVLTHGASPLIHKWTPAATTTIDEFWVKNSAIAPVASKYSKIEFNVTGAAADLYVEVITQQDTNN